MVKAGKHGYAVVVPFSCMSSDTTTECSFICTLHTYTVCVHTVVVMCMSATVANVEHQIHTTIVEGELFEAFSFSATYVAVLSLVLYMYIH